MHGSGATEASPPPELELPLEPLFPELALPELMSPELLPIAPELLAISPELLWSPLELELVPPPLLQAKVRAMPRKNKEARFILGFRLTNFEAFRKDNRQKTIRHRVRCCMLSSKGYHA
jgi:hypothetical protein